MLNNARRAFSETPVKQSLLMELYGQIMNRKKLGYGLFGVIKFKLFCCCKKSIPQELQMMDSLYQQGMKKIDKELDIRNITKQLRTLKFVTDVLLTKYQRFMIPHCKEHIINQVQIEKTKPLLTQDQEQEKSKTQLALIRDGLAQTIEDSCSSKLDQRILKNIDAGTDHIHELTRLLKEMSRLNINKKQHAEKLIKSLALPAKPYTPTHHSRRKKTLGATYNSSESPFIKGRP